MSKNASTISKQWQMPDTLIIIFFVALFASCLTYFIPQGHFNTKQIDYINEQGVTKTKTIPMPETFQFHLDEQTQQPSPQGIAIFEEGGGIGFTNFIYNGITSGNMWGTAVGVIAFILLVGGAFGVIIRTGAVDNGIMAIINKTSKMEILIIPITFIIFSLGGAIFGMGEEAIAFAMIVVPLVVRLGYDAAVGVLITYVATQIGFATSPMNPFSAVIANGIAGLPPVSIPHFKWTLVAIFTLTGVLFTFWYAVRVKKNPRKSICQEANQYFLAKAQEGTTQGEYFSLGHGLVILTLVTGIVWMTYGILDKDKAYYFPELATIFVIIGVVAGIIGVLFRLRGMRMNDIPSAFVGGAKDLLGAALVVGMAKGIVLILGGDSPEKLSVLNTILYWTNQALAGVSVALGSWLMFMFQSVFNFFVVSGSGQAALTMPFMSPLADLMHVSRHIAVIAFQLGDGLTNIIVPTSGALIGTLAVARIPWNQWAKFILSFQVILIALASVVVIVATMIY